MSNINSIIAGSAAIKLSIDVNDLKEGLVKSRQQIKSFSEALDVFSKKMLVYSPFLTAPVVSAVKVFSNFDDQMRLAGAVIGTTGKAFEQLTEKAKQLGRETSFTASEVASGMVSLGRMGFSSTEIEKSIGSMMNLAKATGTDQQMHTPNRNLSFLRA